MKVVVLSDTHLNHVNRDLERLCDRYCRETDLVIHLGDWVRAPVLEFFEQYPLEGVCGNMDDAAIRSRLPDLKVLHLNGHRVGIVHGWGPGGDLRARLRGEFSGVEAILYGHTHLPFKGTEDGVFWMNPGSVFSGRGRVRSSLAILHLGSNIDGEIVEL